MKPATLVFLLVFFLAGCAGMLHPRDGRTAEEHQRQADELILARNFAAASEELALAIRKKTREGRVYLRQGEILETLGKSEQAGITYNKGMRIVSKDSPLRKEIVFRLALLYATDLNAPKKAGKLLAGFPDGSIQHYDLKAVLATREGNAREALALLNKALMQKPTKSMAAHILFHAAKAYHLLGDEEKATKSLFQAINLSDNLALNKDIEIFRDKLNAGRSPGTDH